MLLALVNCCIACSSKPHSTDSDPNEGYSTPPPPTEQNNAKPGETYNHGADTTLMPENTPDSPPRAVKPAR